MGLGQKRQLVGLWIGLLLLLLLWSKQSLLLQIQGNVLNVQTLVKASGKFVTALSWNLHAF